MARGLVIAPEAANDIAEAYEWYEDRRRGLGEEFLSAVDASLQRILRTSDIYSVVYETYRRALVRRFPYAVFYENTATHVTVYAVFHMARDPGKWRERLR
jgi:plasmid stabilization system protein ParE